MLVRHTQQPHGGQFQPGIQRGGKILTKQNGRTRIAKKIAEARIQVEGAIQQVKTFHILDNEVRLCMAHLAEQIFTVCSYLINFQSPILQQ